MKYLLMVNNYATDGRFADEEGLKNYLLHWKWNGDEQFVVEDEDEVPMDVTVDELVKLLLEEEKVVCLTQCMCEMGDDFVDLLLVKL